MRHTNENDKLLQIKLMIPTLDICLITGALSKEQRSKMIDYTTVSTGYLDYLFLCVCLRNFTEIKEIGIMFS